MQSTSRAFLEILKVPHAEVWLVKNKVGSSLARGNLEVLYSKTLNYFILRVHDFKIGLDKSMQVVGTVSDKSKYHSYLFAHPDGFIIMKVIDSDPAVPINNFETILYNTTHFVRKSGLEHRLDTFTHGGALHKASEAFSKAKTDNSHPNQRIVRTFSELIDIESSGVPLVDIPSDVVQNLKDEGEELARNHQEADHWKEYTRWGGIEGDTLTVGHALPVDHNSTTELGDKLEILGFNKNKDLKLPETRVDPTLGARTGLNTSDTTNTDAVYKSELA